MRQALTEGASHHGGMPIARWVLWLFVASLMAMPGVITLLLVYTTR